ncbi:MAG: bile acid:sodium symporter family protein, partial [Rhizobiaceae bacterium]
HKRPEFREVCLMGVLLAVFLPLSLAFIMFSLGLGLTLADFARVFSRPRAFVAGFIAQLIVLPLTAYVIMRFSSLEGALAVGVMILAFSPGGVTSNIMTKLADGAVAVSISLTAIVSLVAVITVPVLTAWAADAFMGAVAPDINVSSLAISMFAITAVPVAIGVAFRHLATRMAFRIEPVVSIVATVLFVVIVVGALLANWSTFAANIGKLGPVLVILNIVLLTLGYGVALLLGLPRDERIAVAIETGVQNATLGITVGSLIVEAATGLPPFSLPSGVYGITMYVVTLPFVFWMKSRHRAS